MTRVLRLLGDDAVATSARDHRAARRATTGVLIATALLLAACGGGGDDDDASAETQGLAAPEESQETENAEGTIEPETFAFDRSVRYAGFVFHLGDAELGPSEDFDGNPDPSVGRLTIETQIENLGPDTATPRPELHFEREGAALDVADFSPSELPDVPGEAASNGTIVADGLPADFTMQGIVLVFGSDAVHPSKVPLDGNAPVVSAEPLPITPGEPGKVGEVTITITGGEMRYDSISDHKQFDADKADLVIEFDVTASAAMHESYVSVGAKDLQLGLPDGTRSTPNQSGGTGIERLEPSATLGDLVVIFEVPADVRGAFELVLTGDFGTTDQDEVGGFAPFELNDSVTVTQGSEESD